MNVMSYIFNRYFAALVVVAALFYFFIIGPALSVGDDKEDEPIVSTE